jgi:predicted ATPase/class 3 adenylate cyclase
VAHHWRVRTDLPSGTVTFLFTDVEDSTGLLRELGAEAYGDALTEHRRILRAAFGAYGGVEVDTQGDAFFVAFPTAAGALDAAAHAMAELANGRVRVRMGIHTGAPHVAAEGYVGLDVHRAARIAACGHGGQILVSASTASLVGADGLRDLGEHALKGMARPERIFQLGAGDFPALNTLRRASLPAAPTPFLGRAGELAEVVALGAREDVRLLTLTGPGGTGKTRLALQAASELAWAHPDGVWWVPLAPLRDAGLVLDAAAQVLDAKDGPAAEIGDRSMLVVFDNFEHVIAAGADVAGLLAACPRLDVLVTSREPLHISGEHEYAVPPLERGDSVDLFVARAGAVRHDFEADESVPEICRRLDDLPLALELAAARAKALTAAQILSRLEQRLPLLTGGARDLPARQRTLHATIEWSHELLSPAEQTLFARLAVFHGGCTLDAAERVAAADLDTLQSLVDRSLVRHAGERYWLLETIREYALERLAEAADAQTLRDGHAGFYLELAELAEPEVTGADQARWLERLADDHENLRAALERFLAGGDAQLALRLGGALVVFWFVRGHYGEGRDWLNRVLAVALPDETPALAKALWGAGFLGVLANDYEHAPAVLERAAGLARRVDDLSTLARCQSMLGLLEFFRNDIPQARALFQESIEAARRAGDVWCLADALGTLASIAPLHGDLATAEAAGQEGLAIARASGDQQGVRMSLFALALAALRGGDHDAVDTLGGEGLLRSRELGDPWFTSYFLWLLASVALDRGDAAAARPAAEEALEVGLQAGGALLVVCAREVLARVEWAEGDEAAARRELETALAASAAGGVPASYIAAARLTLGRLDLAAGDGSLARSHLEAARELAGSVGDTWLVERAEAALAEA